jgi:molecular chaperone IbpA
LNNELTITGKSNKLSTGGDETSIDETSKEITLSPMYLYRGISNRQFQKRFVLNNNTNITNINLKDGLLTIDFVIQPPELEQSKKFLITSD